MCIRDSDPPVPDVATVVTWPLEARLSRAAQAFVHLVAGTARPALTDAAAPEAEPDGAAS